MTLADKLIRLPEEDPSHEIFTFFQFDRTDGGDRKGLTASELLARSQACAARLQDMCQPFDRVLILCQPGLDYIVAFYACQLAGVIAVPLHPPSNRRHVGRLLSIIKDADASVILTISDLTAKLARLSEGDRPFPMLLGIDSIGLDDADSLVMPNLAPDDVSFLQYTSGTTGNPRGVIVKHEQLLNNVAGIIDRYRLTSEARGFSWLPPHHDMGLVSALITPVVICAKTALISPAAFLQRPLRWLEGISRFGATVTTGPNFAYQLCVDRIYETDTSSLDLSTLQLALCGAEPVSAATLDSFCDKFGRFGFRRNSFVPVYGLAETVVMATGYPPSFGPKILKFSEPQNKMPGETPRLATDLTDAGNAKTKTVVSCGPVIDNHEIEIVDPETGTICTEGSVGEIWLQGPSVASGYWGRREETDAVFGAQLDGAPAGERWLITGDLGTLVDGELYVLGRLKEMVIVNGRNYYAQDIETAAEAADPVLGHNRTIAFGLQENGAEQVVLVHELTRSLLRDLDAPALASVMRRAVLDTQEIGVSAIMFIRPSRLPRTTSGKLQRGKARDLYLAGTLYPVTEWHARTNIVTGHDVSMARRWSGRSDLPALGDIVERLNDIPGISDVALAYRLEADGGVSIDVAVAPNASVPPRIGDAAEGDSRIRFGLFFFGSDDPVIGDEPRYDLLLKAAEAADAAGLEAVWTPERHFGVFGGQYPSPVATSAALAGRTKQIALRAGSVVMPLNHPIRVAEDWAVIDNISGGRVGVSFASGWHARDFVLMPGAHADRYAKMMQGIETVRRLWRGEEMTFSNGDDEVPIVIRPRPLQDEIPVWLTAAGNPETFREAGRRGMNLLTFMAQTSPKALSEKIDLYRRAFFAGQSGDAGDAARPHATVMVHTLLAGSTNEARAKAEGPMRRYVRDAMRLAVGAGVGESALAGAEDALLDTAVNQFLSDRGLFGAPNEIREKVLSWQASGVDELACLVDFGLPADEVLSHLEYLFELDAACRRATERQPDRSRRDLPARVLARLEDAVADLTVHVHAVEDQTGAALQKRLTGLLTRARSSIKPRTPTEELVASIFVELLDIDRAGVDDDFFALGGHSLLATRLVGRLEADTGKTLEMSSIFETPTVEGLAAALDQIVFEPTDEDIQILIDEPDTAAEFDEAFGSGSAQFYLERHRAPTNS